ncbi:MAG: alanine racemase [Clostridia bacterium]|nr:alanine racemase [Clostridia bacterium]MDR3645448.1 alanine racemase [Clostridia bacterium]
MTTLIVQKDKLLYNLKAIQAMTGVQVIPVLKGNAYGLGEIEVGRLFFDAGVRLFAVSRIEEAERLAAALPHAEILLLTPYSTESDVRRIVAAGVTATIGSYESAVLLNGIAEQCGVKSRVHIKFDTGMGRFGFLPEDAEKAAQAAKYLNNLEVCGCFSHLSNCFGRDKKSVFRQLDLFMKCIGTLRRAEIEPGIVHLAGSSGAILYPKLRLGAVRIGSALLGRVSVKNKLQLKKIGRLESEICEIRWLPAGHNIGYANTYKTKKPMRIAVIPVGYADGLFVEKIRDTFRMRDILRFGWQDFRLLFGRDKLYCEIGGKRAPVIGRIGLCNVIADVSDLDCNTGDIAAFDTNPLFVNSNVERTYI